MCSTKHILYPVTFNMHAQHPNLLLAAAAITGTTQRRVCVCSIWESCSIAARCSHTFFGRLPTRKRKANTFFFLYIYFLFYNKMVMLYLWWPDCWLVGDLRHVSWTGAEVAIGMFHSIGSSKWGFPHGLGSVWLLHASLLLLLPLPWLSMKFLCSWILCLSSAWGSLSESCCRKLS